MIIILFVLIIMLITGSVIGFILERKGFNNGICPHCDKELRYFDTDSQGGRGYCCDCGYCTWISYKCIDSANKIWKVNFMTLKAKSISDLKTLFYFSWRRKYIWKIQS